MFWDANKKEVKTYEIVDLFATEKLKNKPKLFWFQFCRSNFFILIDRVIKKTFKYVLYRIVLYRIKLRV